jgi:hypothetical protein
VYFPVDFSQSASVTVKMLVLLSGQMISTPSEMISLELTINSTLLISLPLSIAAIQMISRSPNSQHQWNSSNNHLFSNDQPDPNY